MQTITRNGEKYVLVPQHAWQKLTSGAISMPPLPEADAAGNRPAIEFARATIARGIIRDRVAAGLSQAQLARMARIRVETQNRIEKAKVTADPATIDKIDKALRSAAGVRARAASRKAS